jgi:hypothetical protein
MAIAEATAGGKDIARTQVADALQSGNKINILASIWPVFIQQRTDFATSMIDGRTVCELEPGGRSALEIARLWDYVAGQLQKQERQRIFQQPIALGFGRRVSL